MWDFLDSASETGTTGGYENGIQLHLALVEAVDPLRPISDYYRHHLHKDDGGYLRSLVEACRRLSGRLPSFDRVRPVLIREAYRANVQAITTMPILGCAPRRYADGPSRSTPALNPFRGSS